VAAIPAVAPPGPGVVGVAADLGISVLAAELFNQVLKIDHLHPERHARYWLPRTARPVRCWC
jgi:hypothetical protein